MHEHGKNNKNKKICKNLPLVLVLLNQRRPEDLAAVVHEFSSMRVVICGI